MSYFTDILLRKYPILQISCFAARVPDLTLYLHLFVKALRNDVMAAKLGSFIGGTVPFVNCWYSKFGTCADYRHPVSLSKQDVLMRAGSSKQDVLMRLC